MPSIITHPAVPLALAVALGSRAIPARLLAVGIVGSILPDLDVLAFRFGIPYADAFGHRGFSHSLLFAALIGLAAMPWQRWLGTTWWRAFLFVFVCVASHGALDACTNGGLGIAFLWPWSQQRFFAPWQFIAVAPLGIARFFSPRGLAVLRSELLWVWLPLFAAAFACALPRWLHSTHRHFARSRS